MEVKAHRRGRIRDDKGEHNMQAQQPQHTLTRLVPGLVLVAAISLVARFIHSLYTPISDVMLAIVLGLLVANLIQLPHSARAGMEFSSKRLLKVGINPPRRFTYLGRAIEIGAASLTVIVVCILSAFLITLSLARLLRVEGPVRHTDWGWNSDLRQVQLSWLVHP